MYPLFYCKPLYKYYNKHDFNKNIKQIDTSNKHLFLSFNLLHIVKYKFFMSFSINKNEDSVTSVRILVTLLSVTSENSDLSETKYNLYYD